MKLAIKKSSRYQFSRQFQRNFPANYFLPLLKGLLFFYPTFISLSKIPRGTLNPIERRHHISIGRGMFNNENYRR